MPTGAASRQFILRHVCQVSINVTGADVQRARAAGYVHITCSLMMRALTFLQAVSNQFGCVRLVRRYTDQQYDRSSSDVFRFA